MARKPIELEMAGMRTPRERVWAAIRKLRTFTRLELQDTALPLVNWATMSSYVKWLERAGHVQPVTTAPRAPGRKSEITFRLVKDALEAPRVSKRGERVTQGAATLAMWRAMRTLHQWNWHDIQRAARIVVQCDEPVYVQCAGVGDIARDRVGIRGGEGDWGGYGADDLRIGRGHGGRASADGERKLNGDCNPSARRRARLWSI